MHGDANRRQAAEAGWRARVSRDGVGGPRRSWPRTSQPYL